MKKKLFGLMFLAAFALTVGACAPSTPSSSSEETSSSERVTRYTVAFNVDGERHYTAMVKEGEKITDTVPNPSKENYRFLGWYEEGTLVDLTTYVVMKDTTFDAGFEEIADEDVLSVDDVKVEGEEYYMVLGWWEVNDPEDPEKVTSGLTKDSVRVFYTNLIKYLKAMGATDANIDAIQFRNYSTAKVADMGTMVNTDGDVDILIGVGANVFTTAGVLPYNTSDDSKFQTSMGEKSRYVALVQGASEMAKTTYDWLQTEVGMSTFLGDVDEDVIAGSLGGDVINLSVTVHGDTSVTTVLDDKDDIIEMPTITVPENYEFAGFDTENGTDVKLDVAIDAELKWADVKDLVADGATTLDLYPVLVQLEEEPVDLVVYIQVNGNYLTEPEASLLCDRFNSTVTDVAVEYVVLEADAAGFTASLGDDADVIIGGNNPLKNYTAHADGPLANTGALHFANTSRKVMIAETVDPEHLELAKALYNFVVADAIPFVMHSTFWTKDFAWITEEEIATHKAGIEAHLETLFGLEGDETLASVYNFTLEWYIATNTKVADLCVETKALNDGKGTDLIIACGKNVDSEGNMIAYAKKQVSLDQIAADRYVALTAQKLMAYEVYQNYFIEKTA